MNTEKHNGLYVDFGKKYYHSDCNVVSRYDRNNSVNVSTISVNESLILDFESSLEAVFEKQSSLNVLRLAKSQFFRGVLEPLYKWLLGLENAIAVYEPKFINFGCIYKSRAIFTYEAEGEVNKQWLYKDNYFIPGILVLYIRGKYPSIKLIYEECNPVEVIVKFYLRNVVYLTAVHGYSLLRNIVEWKSRNKALPYSDKIILLVRNRIQSDLALKLLSSFPKDFVLASFEQATSISNNFSYLNSKNVEFISLSNHISSIFIIRSYISSIFNLFKTKNKIELPLVSGKISLPLEYALKDLHARASDFRLLGHAVKGLKGRKVISFDMFTPHASYVANSLGQENTLQVQASLISPKPETFFIPGTSFAFIDRVSYERFIEINKRYKDKCIYLGNIKLLGLRERLRKNTKVENIIYFTQPYEHNSEKEILLKLEGICNQLGVRLTVKLHPRQKMNEYEYLQSITFLSDEFNADKYDLALTRSSSIAMDCWAASLPIAFIRETSYTKNLTAEYIPENYTGDLTKVSEVKDLIENYSMFHARFMNARCKLLNDGQVGNVIGNIKRAYINEK